MSSEAEANFRNPELQRDSAEVRRVKRGRGKEKFSSPPL